MTHNDYIEAEQVLNRISSGLRGIVNKETIDNLQKINFVLSEVRHASVLLHDGSKKSEIIERLMLVLFRSSVDFNLIDLGSEKVNLDDEIPNLTKTLNSGAESDIWYDAADHGDTENQNIINATKASMIRSATLMVVMKGEIDRLNEKVLSLKK